LQLPDAFKDFATENMGGKGPSNALMTHCRREVMHAQWDILLDEEFLEAYQHSIVVVCCDGIIRRFYPWLLTYSADYPEKYVPLFSPSLLSAYLAAKGFSLPVSVAKALAPAQDALFLSRACITLG
jgi:hypothetical protein